MSYSSIMLETGMVSKEYVRIAYPDEYNLDYKINLSADYEIDLEEKAVEYIEDFIKMTRPKLNKKIRSLLQQLKDKNIITFEVKLMYAEPTPEKIMSMDGSLQAKVIYAPEEDNIEYERILAKTLVNYNLKDKKSLFFSRTKNGREANESFATQIRALAKKKGYNRYYTALQISLTEEGKKAQINNDLNDKRAIRQRVRQSVINENDILKVIPIDMAKLLLERCFSSPNLY